MIYLLDANVLIDANRDYYPMSRVPEFWDWVVHTAAEGLVKIPVEIYDEIKEGHDDLADWVNSSYVRSVLLFDADPDVSLVDYVVKTAYASDITDDELVKLGRDPFLLAYALTSPQEFRIVTTEVSKPSRTRANRHLPDAARILGIVTQTTFQFLRELDFRTNWR